MINCNIFYRITWKIYVPQLIWKSSVVRNLYLTNLEMFMNWKTSIGHHRAIECHWSARSLLILARKTSIGFQWPCLITNGYHGAIFCFFTFETFPRPFCIEIPGEGYQIPPVAFSSKDAIAHCPLLQGSSEATQPTCHQVLHGGG